MANGRSISHRCLWKYIFMENLPMWGQSLADIFYLHGEPQRVSGRLAVEAEMLADEDLVGTVELVGARGC